MSYPNGTLIIEVVSLSDDGMYACNVENGVGDALNKNLWISVNSKLVLVKLFNDKNTSPWNTTTHNQRTKTRLWKRNGQISNQ